MVDASGMEEFKLEKIELEESKFVLLLEDVDVGNPKKCSGQVGEALNKTKVSGVYFWVMCWNSQCYRIYVGLSTDIAGRLKKYTEPFQVYTPNNFKMRCFYEFMKDEFPDARLDLYYLDYAGLNKTHLHRHENMWIEKFKPLINVLGKVSKYKSSINVLGRLENNLRITQAKLKAQDSFRELYVESFKAAGFSKRRSHC